MRPTGTSLTDRILQEARVSGLDGLRPPSLEAVERRRIEIWGLTVALFIVATAGAMLLSVWPGLTDSIPWVSPTVVRVTLPALSVGFLAYAVEKERALRRLSRLLVDERIVNAALANRVKELALLMTVGKAVNSVLRLEEVLDIILSSAVELLDGRGGSVMLVEGEELRPVAVRGEEASRHAPREVADRVAATREPRLYGGGRGGSGVVVPLINRDELLGVLTVTAGEERKFGEYDLRILTIFADQAAVSIANARLYEAQRARTTELAAVSQLKSEFVKVLSQELHTPLTSILGTVITLRGLDLSPKEQDGLLGVIERQGRRALRLIERLATDPLREKRPAAPSRPVDLVPVVRSVAQDYARAGGPVHVTTPSSCVVLGDEDVFRRVLVTLIDNAHKHGRPPVRVVVETDEDRALLSVLDAGPGVPPENRERIFDRRSRPDGGESTARSDLSIVRAVVTALRGRIWVEDAPHGGAAFRVSLPAHAPDRVAS